MEIETDKLLQVMKGAALGCGKLMSRAAEEQITAHTKTSFRDLVTEYDVQIQDYAITKLSAAFPEASFISEEKDSFEPCAQALCFVIDPIDGTANFVHHFRHSCTSIACVQDGVPVAAVVYDPFAGELFHAVKGGGAFLNEQQLYIPEHSLSETLVLFGSVPYNMELAEETSRNVQTIFGRCQDIRRSGSAALDLCYVAAGRAGLYFESIISVWDYAAGALLVQEAGGTCVSLKGTPLVFDRPVKSSCIAGKEELIRESRLLSE